MWYWIGANVLAALACFVMAYSAEKSSNYDTRSSAFIGYGMMVAFGFIAIVLILVYGFYRVFIQ